MIDWPAAMVPGRVGVVVTVRIEAGEKPVATEPGAALAASPWGPVPVADAVLATAMAGLAAAAALSMSVWERL